MLLIWRLTRDVPRRLDDIYPIAVRATNKWSRNAGRSLVFVEDRVGRPLKPNVSRVDEWRMTDFGKDWILKGVNQSSIKREEESAYWANVKRMYESAVKECVKEGRQFVKDFEFARWNIARRREQRDARHIKAALSLIKQIKESYREKSKQHG